MTYQALFCEIYEEQNKNILIRQPNVPRVSVWSVNCQCQIVNVFILFVTKVNPRLFSLLNKNDPDTFIPNK